MEMNFLVNSSSSCVEWVLALALIAVGAIVVRKAESRAGLLVIGTGALWLLESCCAYSPDLYLQVRSGYGDRMETIHTVTNLLSFFFFAVGMLMLIGAAVVMARAITALPAGDAR